ncbi:hypothetical protein [Romboutsia sp. 1001713B170207_170306_H8]|uniref:hypothetical protein n=1 Tax=Romboutsia sp. 1001713B170207_170306_H8 TaxID=2787112 RepID=UPI00189AB512|nr:hypothetical protein [Romboutsia sp. 1001713B170207_170306_H8]
MSKETYNLQIPISTSFKDILKELADEDDRALRVYCRRVLEEHVKSLGKDIENKDKTNKENVTTKDVTKETEPTKPKVGGFR